MRWRVRPFTTAFVILGIVATGLNLLIAMGSRSAAIEDAADREAATFALAVQSFSSSIFARLEAASAVALTTTDGETIRELFESSNPALVGLEVVALDWSQRSAPVTPVVSIGPRLAQPPPESELEDVLADAVARRRSFRTLEDGMLIMASGRGSAATGVVAYSIFDLAAMGDRPADELQRVALRVVGASPMPDGGSLVVGDRTLHADDHAVGERTFAVAGTEVQVLARADQSGTLDDLILPLLVATLGLGLTASIAIGIELVSRRRDSLERSVVELQSANDELDEALRERRAAEQVQQRLERELRHGHRMQAVGQLAGGLAHDFNNVLAAIDSFAELVEPEVSGEAADDVGQIRLAAERGMSLTSQLLLFSRRDTGEPEVFDLGAVLCDLETLLSRTLGSAIALTVDLPRGAVHVRAHQAEVEQVIVNLAINARDAMFRHGKLHVELREEPSSDTGGGMAVLRVSDTGEGISPALIERIFEPFFTTKTREHGTGMGLATAYGVLERIGGRITVESTVGAGSTFTVNIPLADG